MGKYMRKGKGAGKVAVMEVSQGALGVRTRAKTLALVEQDRKLALSISASPKHQQTGVAGLFDTTYLELRSRKLEKVVKEMERPVRGISTREGSLNEDGRNLPKVDGMTAVEEVKCTERPEGNEVLLHAEFVGSSRTPELSPKPVDCCRKFLEFPIESALSAPRATVDGAQLRCRMSGVGEKPFRLENVAPERSSGDSRAHEVVQGGVSPADEGLFQDELVYGHPEPEASCEYSSVELGISPGRRRSFRGSPVSIFKEREGVSDTDPGHSTRAGFFGDRQDRRMANHNRIMVQNRRYMRTNLFSDAKAIDELFAAPDTTDREEGKRFTERYNFDVVNDKPLKGRYEWVPAVGACNITTPTTQHSTDQQQPRRS